MVKFYTQAFGSLFGLLVCLFYYVYGDLVMIGSSFSESFIESITGYLLYPMCLLSFFMSFGWLFIKSYRFIKVNKYLVHAIVILGLLGCRYHFIIPSILITYSYYSEVVFANDIKKRENYKKAAYLLDQNMSVLSIIKLFNISYEEILKFCKL